jgi:hypothetical protein
MPSANSTVGQFYAQGSLWRNQNPSSWRFTFLRTVSLSCESAADGIRILPEGNTSTLQAVADQIRRIDDSTLRLELLGANGGAPATVLAGNEAIAGFFFNPREVTPKGVFATISKTSVLQDPMVLRLQIILGTADTLGTDHELVLARVCRCALKDLSTDELCCVE